MNFLSWIGVYSFICIQFFRHKVINIALIPKTNSALFWLNLVKKSCSIHIVWIVYFLINVVKKSCISIILWNWSSLVGDFFSNRRIPESAIFMFLSINAYPNFLTQGSIQRIMVYRQIKYYRMDSGCNTWPRSKHGAGCQNDVLYG